MPPAPSAPTISYEPRRAPVVSNVGLLITRRRVSCVLLHATWCMTWSELLLDVPGELEGTTARGRCEYHFAFRNSQGAATPSIGNASREDDAVLVCREPRRLRVGFEPIQNETRWNGTLPYSVNVESHTVPEVTNSCDLHDAAAEYQIERFVRQNSGPISTDTFIR